ncbi:MAG: hypothetical protein ACR2HS_00710, partial [Gammaproteobacteria bacterium]
MHKEQDKEILQKIEYLKQLANNSQKTFKENLSVLENLITEISKKQDEFDNEILELITHTLAKLQTNDKSKKPLIKEILDLATNKDNLFSILLNGLNKLQVSTNSLSFLSKSSKKPESTNSNILENLIKYIYANKDDLSNFHQQQHITNELLHLHPNNSEKQKIINELLREIQKTITIDEQRQIKNTDKINKTEIESDLYRLLSKDKPNTISFTINNTDLVEELKSLSHVTDKTVKQQTLIKKMREMLNLPEIHNEQEDKFLRFFKSIKAVDLTQTAINPINNPTDDPNANLLMSISDVINGKINYKINAPSGADPIEIEYTAEVYLAPFPSVKTCEFLEVKENIPPKLIKADNKNICYALKIIASYNKNTEELTLKSTT